VAPLGQRVDPRHGYFKFVEFARALAGAIGQERLKSIFFGKGDHQYEALAAEVGRIPRRGTFTQMMNSLTAGNYFNAIALLKPR
jgi:hypothetical protein